MHSEVLLKEYAITDTRPWFVRVRNGDIKISKYLEQRLVQPIHLNNDDVWLYLEDHLVQFQHCHRRP
jgi:hypothetical protein